MDGPEIIALADGRALAVDDVGDRRGVPVVYLHGTPDSRLGRPPDEGAAQAGVRLLALDRPGAGHSDPHPAARLSSLGHDVRAVLDRWGIDQVILLGWSSGGLSALAAATVLGDRVRAVGLIAPIPPVEAYAEADIVSGLGPARRRFAEMALEVPAAELAAEVAPYLVPQPLTPALALEHVLDGAGETGRGELAAVAGSAERLAGSLAASVRQGLVGLQHDVALQLEPGLDLSGIRVPVRTFHGSEDGVSPSIVGAWLVGRLPNAVLDLSPGGSHHLLFPRWAGILRALRRDAAM
ncbi:MAG: alpha/beta hydrolase [Acidimicrobiales bacterium]